jgi:hypothetical protein
MGSVQSEKERRSIGSAGWCYWHLAVGSAYMPLSIGPDGKLTTQNNGHLFVVGN